MLSPTLHWVTGIGSHRLALMARPQGGEWLGEEVSALREAKVDSLVSLLEPAEVRELALNDEPTLCGKYGIAYRSFPIPDRGTPLSVARFTPLLLEVHSELLENKAVAIHCRAGIGPSKVSSVPIENAMAVSPVPHFALT